MTIHTDTWNTSSEAFNFKSHYSGRIKDWVRTPNFGALAKDAKPINYYRDEQVKIDQKIRHQYTLNYDGTQLLVNNYGPAYADEGRAIHDGFLAQMDGRPEWTSAIAPLENAAKLKALVKTADAKVNVAVAYAEASKTSDMILSTARRIDRAYRAFRRGDLKTIAKELNITPKRLHKSWLEYKYGWLPLLMDVKGAAEFFAQQHVVRAPRFTVVAREKVLVNFSHNATFAAFGGGTGTYEYYKSGFREVTVKLWCELTSPHLSELQQIGLTNPLLVAWELVPFSFVWDWFISIGDWLTGLTALQGVYVRKAMVSILDVKGGTLDVRKTTYQLNPASNIYIDDAWGWAASVRTYTRDLWIPSASEVYPPVKGSLSFSKLVTGLALIQGNYRGAGSGHLRV